MRRSLPLLGILFFCLPACAPDADVDLESAASALDRWRLDVPIRDYLEPELCPAEPHTVEIPTADPAVDRSHHDRMRDLLMASVGCPDTTILLGPRVVLDFGGCPPRRPRPHGALLQRGGDRPGGLPRVDKPVCLLERQAS